MPPFHLPWCTFLSFVVVGGSLLLAVAWALIDKRCDKEIDKRRDEGRGQDRSTPRHGEARP